MSKLSLDMEIYDKQVVIDLPAPTTKGFLSLDSDAMVLALRNLWNEGERISKTSVYRRAFCTRLVAIFFFGSANHEICFSYIGAGANRIAFKNNQIVLKLSSIPISKQDNRHWEDSSVLERRFLRMGIVGVLPILLEGKVPLEENGEEYYFQIQPFADMTLNMVFKHLSSNGPVRNGTTDFTQLFGFYLFVVINMIHLFRRNSKLHIILGDIVTSNVSLRHGMLKILDWEA